MKQRVTVLVRRLLAPVRFCLGVFIGATLRAEPKTLSGYAFVKFSGNPTRGTLIPECLWFAVSQKNNQTLVYLETSCSCLMLNNEPFSFYYSSLFLLVATRLHICYLPGKLDLQRKLPTSEQSFQCVYLLISFSTFV